MIHPAVAVFEHNLVSYRRVWRGSVFSSFLLPVLFLLGMGVSVGSYVDARDGLDVEYLDYIAPGLLASTALQVAFGESTYPVFSAFNWARSYHGARASPLRIVDIVFGNIGFVLFRVAIASIGFLVVMTAFGAVHSVRAPLALVASVLLGLALAAPVFGVSATITTESMFPLLLRFGIIPMTLFAGVFFPIDSLPLAARILAYVSPLWHCVELCRASTLGGATAWGALAHIGYLVLWAAVGLWFAVARFTKRLAD